MEKQIKKIDESLKKISEWKEKTINWDFKNNELIFQFLDKRESILSKTRKKLVKLNLNNLLTWEESQKPIIS